MKLVNLELEFSEHEGLQDAKKFNKLTLKSKIEKLDCFDLSYKGNYAKTYLDCTFDDGSVVRGRMDLGDRTRVLGFIQTLRKDATI